MSRRDEVSPPRDVIPDLEEEVKAATALRDEEKTIEEQMTKQEKEDDADLKALKEKLKKLRETQPSSDKKDDLIKNLMSRLTQAEEAITAAEEVISHERANRKLLFQEVTKANMDLRELIEKEKKNLSEKVQAELDKTLQ